MKKNITGNDPRGLIYESYNIVDINVKDCRTIFLDWYLGLEENIDPVLEIKILYDHYGKLFESHPMNQVLLEGIKGKISKPKRRKRNK